MGLGNGNPNSGNKGSNWRYEYNVLKALECIVNNTTGTGGACCPETNTLLTTTNTLLTSIINSTRKGTVSTSTQVAANVASQTLKAANVNRVKLVVVNDGDSILFVKEGAAASTSSYTYKLSPDDTVIIDDYTGLVAGIWLVADGNAEVTETV